MGINRTITKGIGIIGTVTTAIQAAMLAIEAAKALVRVVKVKRKDDVAGARGAAMVAASTSPKPDPTPS